MAAAQHLNFRRRLLSVVPVLMSSKKYSFSDDFNRADGAIGGSWTGATWTISGNKAINTPTVGAELLTNGNFAAWTGDNPDNWTVTGESGGNEVSEVGAGEGHGGAGTGFCNFYTTSALISIAQAIKTIGRFYRAGATINKTVSGGLNISGGTVNRTLNAAGDELCTNVALTILRNSGATDVTIDDATCKELTGVFCTQDFGKVDVTIQAKLTRSASAGGMLGLVLALDDAAVPTKFIIAFVDNYSGVSPAANLYKWTQAGGTTQLIRVNYAYVAGAVLKVIKRGTSVSLWYNGAQIGATQTVSGINGTIHGMFSTGVVGASLDDFSLTSP